MEQVLGGMILVEQWSHNHKGCSREKCPWYTKKRRRGGGCSCWKAHYLCSAAMCSAEESLKTVEYFICDTFFYIFSGIEECFVCIVM